MSHIIPRLARSAGESGPQPMLSVQPVRAAVAVSVPRQHYSAEGARAGCRRQYVPETMAAAEERLVQLSEATVMDAEH